VEEPTTSLFGRRRKRGGRDESATTQRELEVVAELSNAFSRARSPLDVARPLVREVNSLLRVGFAGVVLVDDQRREATGVYAEVEGRSAIVSGPSRLHGGTVTVPDIRSGAALVVAALCASGTTTLDNIYHLDRGYQDIVIKLEHLGAHITRVEGQTDIRPDLSRVVGD